MTKEVNLKQLMAELELVKAPSNWSEITGPFFHLKLPEKSASGPYISSGLKELTEMNLFPEETMVRDAKNIGDWINIYSHPAFQRRKPQIVGDDKGLPESRYAFLLVKGQKYGPVSISEIKTLLNEKEILLTDQVTFDEGHTWKKLYEYKELDRRDLEQGHLPSIPGWDVFKGSHDEISDQLDHAGERERQLNAFAGLAFIENVQHGKAEDLSDGHDNDNYDYSAKGADIVEFKHHIPKHNEDDDLNDESEKSDESTQSGFAKNFAYVMAICLMLGASAYMLFNDPMQGVNLLTGRDAAQKKLIKRGTPTNGRVPASKNEMIKKAENQNNKRAARVNKIKQAPTRMPASITDTDSFRDTRKMKERPFNDNEDPYQDEAYAEDNYDYDDGSTPVAQDRVRKRLDKRTIDSEDQYYDQEQRDEFAETAEGVWGDNESSEQERRVPANEGGDAYDDGAGYGDNQEEQYQEEVPVEAQNLREERYDDAPPQENFENEGEYQEAPQQEQYQEPMQEESYTQEPSYDDGPAGDEY